MTLSPGGWSLAFAIGWWLLLGTAFLSHQVLGVDGHPSTGIALLIAALLAGPFFVGVGAVLIALAVYRRTALRASNAVNDRSWRWTKLAMLLHASAAITQLVMRSSIGF